MGWEMLLIVYNKHLPEPPALYVQQPWSQSLSVYPLAYVLEASLGALHSQVPFVRLYIVDWRSNRLYMAIKEGVNKDLLP